MATAKGSSRVHWGSRLGFILAAAGSAIGLGNIWKFPYIAGVNGGGSFVLIYLICIAVVGIPIFVAELYIGQQSQKNAVQAFEKLHGKKTIWRYIGWMGLVAAFVILSYYSVVAGWVLDFEYKSLTNYFAGHSDEEVKGLLGTLFNDPGRQILWHFIFMVCTVAIVVGGIKEGIERWAGILMPALLFLLVVLFVRVMFEPGFLKAVSFLFSFDNSKLTPRGILEAVGHSFFTLSLGMGCMITYGSYLKKKEHLVPTAITVSIMDTVIALVAGVVIFSVVFSFDLDPSKGPSLMFQTLPVLFAKLFGGYFISVIFFLLVAFAALTSAISLLEVVVTYWVETHKKDRKRTTILFGTLIFLLGIPTALSFNVISDVTVFGFTFFDVMDKLSSSILMPVGGMFISIFFGWVLGPKAVAAAVGKPVNHAFVVFLLWATRLIAPLAVLGVLLNSLGIQLFK